MDLVLLLHWGRLGRQGSTEIPAIFLKHPTFQGSFFIGKKTDNFLTFMLINCADPIMFRNYNFVVFLPMKIWRKLPSKVGYYRKIAGLSVVPWRLELVCPGALAQSLGAWEARVFFSDFDNFKDQYLAKVLFLLHYT